MTEKSPATPSGGQRVAELVQRFNSFSLKTAEAYLGQGKAIYEVEREFGERLREEVYRELQLDPKGSTVRKFKMIGKEHTRLEAHIDRLPNNWTTLALLASMKIEKFNLLVERNTLTPFVTAKQIDDVVRSKPRKKASSRRITINFDEAIDPLSVTKQIRELADKHSLSVDNLNSLEKIFQTEEKAKSQTPDGSPNKEAA